ncbi:MAG: hypothetical protein AB8B50_11745 [Pirellulaceae bacterium]
MAKIAILCGVLLIGLGALGYFGTNPQPKESTNESATEQVGSSIDSEPEEKAGKRSVTALIPAFFGVAMVLCGFLALNEKLLKHAMHGAATVGLLGAIAGGGRGAMGLGKFFSGDPSLNQRSFMYVWLMAIICAVFVFLCVRSFIAVRKQRQAAEAAAS